MKTYLIAVLSILIALLLVSCDALRPTESDESARDVENSVEYSEESQPSGGFTLSASMIKFSADQKVANTSVKAEVSSHIAEKKIAPAERVYKKSPDEEITLSFDWTREQKYANEISYIDVYKDNNGCYYSFDNKTGEFLGYDSDSGDYTNRIYFDDEEFFEKADEIASAFVDVSKYEIIYEHFSNSDNCEKYAFNRIYKRYLNGIPTTEGIICVVFADGSIEYEGHNIGRFDNVVAPEINFDELTQYAIEKVGNLITNPPEGCYVDYDSIKTYDYLYHVNSSGQLELHFSFWYDLLPIDSEESDPHPWHNGMRMVIVFD